MVAFDEQGMLGLLVYFVVRSDGYALATAEPHSGQLLPNTPASESGVLLNTSAGATATIFLQRNQPAQRLYRLTGGGLYRDTLLVGGVAPIAEPLLSSASVLGQDSLMAAPFNGKVYWFFGDTECPAGPRDTDCQHYGRFTTGATSAYTPSHAAANGTNPPSLAYFTSTDPDAPGGMVPDGMPHQQSIAEWNPSSFAHPRAMLAGPGDPPLFNMSTWVGSLTVLPAEGGDGEARMYLTYVCPNGRCESNPTTRARTETVLTVLEDSGGCAHHPCSEGGGGVCASTVHPFRTAP